MMDREAFRKYGHQLVDRIADYYENIEELPVKSQVLPGDIISKIPKDAPQKGESMDEILMDFESIILPGITHWQHPNFHAYFPANTSYPSMLAEMLTSAMGAQCMIWETSPAAAELEEQVMNWLIKLSALPPSWHGVIQDTASTATLAAILSAREHCSDFQINKKGLSNQKMRVYCSTETHSSIEKAVKIAGLGSENLVKIACDEEAAMIPEKLRKAIKADLHNGYRPLIVVAAIGTTGTVGIDPLEPLGKICEEYNIWLHVDAAYAGTAMILPEYQYMLKGVEQADSYVFNPHKWMFTNFDCTAYFVKNKETLIKTFEILPEYLKTRTEGLVNNYRDWGIPLGRRFRALKLWFVIRNFGVEGMQKTLRKHIRMAEDLTAEITAHADFDTVVPTTLNTICFRYVRNNTSDETMNALNKKLIEKINASGEAYLTHTVFKGLYTIRLVIAQTYIEQKHVDKTWAVIRQFANNLSDE
ncbi:MAG: pyridoxal-dependent decarboxylase [Cyclobacteriaceae bacterium]